MTKLSVAKAAKTLGITKEAVYNRIRRGTLQSVTENGLKYVLMEQKPQQQNQSSNQNVENYQEKYINHLLKQVDELKDENKRLHEQKDKLHEEKQNLLVDSKNEMKSLFIERDIQLQGIISILTKPLLEFSKKKLTYQSEEKNDELNAYEKDIVIDVKVEKWQEIGEYMKEKGYSAKKIQYYTILLKKKLKTSKHLKKKKDEIFIRRGKKLKQILKEDWFYKKSPIMLWSVV